MKQFFKQHWMIIVILIAVGGGTVIATLHFQTSDQQKTSLEVHVSKNDGWSVINAQVCGVAAGVSNRIGVNDGQVLTALGAFEANKSITDVVKKDLAYQFAVNDGVVELVGPAKPGVHGIRSDDAIILCNRR